MLASIPARLKARFQSDGMHVRSVDEKETSGWKSRRARTMATTTAQAIQEQNWGDRCGLPDFGLATGGKQ